MALYKGTNKQDSITGSDTHDTIYGFGGNDTLSGGAGDDTIYGDIGSESSAPITETQILGSNTFYADTAIASFRSDWLGKYSNVEIYGTKYDGTRELYNAAGAVTLDQASGAATFASIYGIGVTGNYPESHVKSELGYDPIRNKSEVLEFKITGGTASAVEVDLSRFFQGKFLGAEADQGIEVGFVRAYLAGVEVDLIGSSSVGGIDNSKLGVEFTSTSNNGEYKFKLEGTFDTLVFTALDYKSPHYNDPALKNDSSDYYINELKYTYTKPGTGENSVPDATFNDSISGGDGNDVIYGNAGRDTITAGNGNDKIFGDTGDDTRNGGSATNNADVIDAGAGADTVFGEASADSVNGGDGDDILWGDFGDDKYSPSNWSISYYLGGTSPAFTATTVTTAAGNDTIIGGTGRDTIYGERGNDLINGGAGDDRLFGGIGKDTFDFDSAQMGRDVIHDFTGDSDKIDLSDAGIQNLDKDNNGIINWCDVLVYNGNMVITNEPLPIYNNYILIMDTEELKVTDFIFAV